MVKKLPPRKRCDLIEGGLFIEPTVNDEDGFCITFIEEEACASTIANYGICVGQLLTVSKEVVDDIDDGDLIDISDCDETKNAVAIFFITVLSIALFGACSCLAYVVYNR